jgi:hypothetical protein
MSDNVRSAARIEPNGELLWPFGAVAAVNELAALGRLVLGLDARKNDEVGWSPRFRSMTSSHRAALTMSTTAAMRTEAIIGWARTVEAYRGACSSLPTSEKRGGAGTAPTCGGVKGIRAGQVHVLAGKRL